MKGIQIRSSKYGRPQPVRHTRGSKVAGGVTLAVLAGGAAGLLWQAHSQSTTTSTTT